MSVMVDCGIETLEIYEPLTHWVGRGTGTPKDRDEVN